MADANPWDDLTSGTLDILKSSAKDLIDVEQPEAKALLAELAEEGAKQTYYLTFGNDDQKAQAPGNIRSLKAQAVIDGADLVIVGVAHALAAFGKIVENTGEWLLKYGPTLLAAIPK